jgi:hypothetical protein
MNAEQINERYLESLLQLIELEGKLKGYYERDNQSIFFWEFHAYISDLEIKARKVEGERKLNALEHVKKLKEICNVYHDLYMKSIVFKIKHDKLQQENHELALRVSDLQKELDKINQMNNF